MIPNSTALELQEKLGFAINSFGNVTNFLDLVKAKFHVPLSYNYIDATAERIQFLNMVKELLIYRNSVIIVSPWAYTFPLRDNDSPELENAIGLNDPYEVYYPNGNLIYSVKGHLGVFGNSTFDKALITNFESTDFFFLRYRNYIGDPQFKLLLINHYSNQVVRTNEYSRLKVNSVEREQMISTILFNFNNTVDPADSYAVHFLESVPDINPTALDVVNNPLADVVTYAASPSILYTLGTAGWIVITKNGVPQQLDVPTGTGTNKLIFTQDGDMYYVGIGITNDILRKTFNAAVTREEFNTLAVEIGVSN